MKIKNIYLDDKNNTHVILVDKYGQYEGVAKLHYEDIENMSALTGGYLAEQRAWIKALKEERRRNFFMLKSIKGLYSNLQNIDSITLDDKIKRQFNLKIRDYTEEIKEINETINDIEKTIKRYIETKENLLKRTKEKKKD